MGFFVHTQVITSAKPNAFEIVVLSLLSFLIIFASQPHKPTYRVCSEVRVIKKRSLQKISLIKNQKVDWYSFMIQNWISRKGFPVLFWLPLCVKKMWFISNHVLIWSKRRKKNRSLLIFKRFFFNSWSLDLSVFSNFNSSKLRP